MQGRAVQKHIRTSPRKLREVVYMMKDLSPEQAIEMLPHLNKRAAEPLYKTIKSAVSNAVNQGANPAELIFSEIQINEARTLKRGQPVSRGMWHPIMKRMSHIRVVVTTKNSKKVNNKSQKKEEVKTEKKKEVKKKPSNKATKNK